MRWDLLTLLAHGTFIRLDAQFLQVGSKRATRHPEAIEQPNDLFATDADGNIVIDTENRPRPPAQQTPFFSRG